MTSSRCIALIGPTGSGKSDVAMAWCARAAGREIVAVDAMQVYQGMDIGTAKPTLHDRALVTHHCLDLVPPSSDFSVTQYVEHANVARAAIADRHNTALLVAGTGLYLRALIDPMDVPPQYPQTRLQLEEALAAHGAAQLHNRLVVLDPVAAARMEPSNDRRIVRALEVCLGSGRPFSSFGPGLDHYAPSDIVQVGMLWSRPSLAQRLEQRVHQMIDRGLVDEVARLLDSPGGMSRTAGKALGYQEIAGVIDGSTTLDQAIALTITRSRQYAVRQERWFRRDPRIRWVHVDSDPVAQVVAALDRACPS